MDQTQLKTESIAELLKTLAADSRELVKDELRLARAEMTEKADQLKHSAIMFASAAAPALLAFLVLPFVVVTALQTVMPPWAATLVTFVLFTVIAGVLGAVAYSRFKRLSLAPKETIKSIEETQQWVKKQLS